MRGLFAVVALAVLVVACGSDPIAPTTASQPPQPAPIPAANIIVPNGAAFSVPDCQGRRVLGASFGFPTTGNCHFTGTLQNIGAGCAMNVHGTTTIMDTHSASEWSAALSLVRPNEIFTYSGGPVVMPNTVDYYYVTTPVWTNVRCP